MSEKIVNVYCKEDHLLFERYHKKGGGRLQKCYADEIGSDLTTSTQKEIGERIYCLRCNPMLPVAIVSLIHGRRAYKIIQSGVRKVVT